MLTEALSSSPLQLESQHCSKGTKNHVNTQHSTVALHLLTEGGAYTWHISDGVCLHIMLLPQ